MIFTGNQKTAPPNSMVQTMRKQHLAVSVYFKNKARQESTQQE